MKGCEISKLFFPSAPKVPQAAPRCYRNVGKQSRKEKQCKSRREVSCDKFSNIVSCGKRPNVTCFNLSPFSIALKFKNRLDYVEFKSFKMHKILRTAYSKLYWLNF